MTQREMLAALGLAFVWCGPFVTAFGVFLMFVFGTTKP